MPKSINYLVLLPMERSISLTGGSSFSRLCASLAHLEGRLQSGSAPEFLKEEYFGLFRLAQRVICNSLADDCLSSVKYELPGDGAGSLLFGEIVRAIPLAAEATVIKRDQRAIRRSIPRAAPSFVPLFIERGLKALRLDCLELFGYEDALVHEEYDVLPPQVGCFQKGDCCKLIILPGSAILRGLTVVRNLIGYGNTASPLHQQFEEVFVSAAKSNQGLLNLSLTA